MLKGRERHKALLLVNSCINKGDYYHFDTPLTVNHEIEALTAAGFKKADIIGKWGSTACIKTVK